MPAWKNITLSLPEQDLIIVSDKISTIRRILSITIIDRLTESKSKWFDQLNESQNLKGETHLIQLLVSAVTESKDLLKDICSLVNDKSIEIVSEEIFEDRDWIQHSKNQFKEVLISDSFRIIPPWIVDKGFSGKTILIEPGSGFGTGTHATTQLCLKWMEKNLVKGTNILDYGCSTGDFLAKINNTKNKFGVEVNISNINYIRKNLPKINVKPIISALIINPSASKPPLKV